MQSLAKSAAPNAIRPWKVPPGMKAEDAFSKELDLGDPFNAL